ncbi:hypothetical protein R3P38DRAFT_2824618 [Favolaschia claudopus]|uniref:Uncharacterized protein n=1 Tax=Favolaschia claudopus TaxID=2862362 RepID=A0AAW0EHL0_9AGAR
MSDSPSVDSSLAAQEPVHNLSPTPNLPSAQPQAKPNRRTGRGSLVELVEAEFTPFDCEEGVIFPFQDETARDDAFQKELNEMLYDAALQTHAWASARPFHETDTATRKYEQQIMGIQNKENEQGMLTNRPPSLFPFVSLVFEKTRQRLNDFVTRMRSALAALTGMVV